MRNEKGASNATVLKIERGIDRVGSAFGADGDRADNLAANDKVRLDVNQSAKPTSIGLNDAIAQSCPSNLPRHLSLS